MRNCEHKRIILFGTEETGLQKAKCATCNRPMTRALSPDGKEYDYFPLIDTIDDFLKY